MSWQRNAARGGPIGRETVEPLAVKCCNHEVACERARAVRGVVGPLREGANRTAGRQRLANDRGRIVVHRADERRNVALRLPELDRRRYGHIEAQAVAGQRRLVRIDVDAALDRVARVNRHRDAVVTGQGRDAGKARGLGTGIAYRARVLVVAGRGVGGVEARASLRVARVIGARVVVVARNRAGRKRDVRVQALSGHRVTGIKGQRVAVAAIRHQTGDARRIHAEIHVRAGIAVGAGVAIDGEQAVARRLLTGVIRADVAVRALLHLAADAFAGDARIHDRAIVIVKARRGVVGVEALARFRVAGVIRARIAVVAIRELADAVGAHAGVATGASIAVRARRGVIHVVHATAGGAHALVGGAIIAIGAVGDCADAFAARAGIARCAGVAVGADYRIVDVRAIALDVARVVRAGVGVVAILQAAHALGAHARVAGGAGIAVVAQRVVERVDADTIVARVVRAELTVSAVQLGAGADAGGADIRDRAIVIVVARQGVVRVEALARFRVAPVAGARVAVVAIRIDLRALAVLAMVARCAGVAVGARRVIDELHADAAFASIIRADVVVVADFRLAETSSADANVAGGAIVAIVAGQGVGDVQARAGSLVTRIVGARVAVVAVRLLSGNARRVGADVADRAGIAVGAADAVQGVIAFAGRAAGIIRADKAVIAIQLGAHATTIDASVADGARLTVRALGFLRVVLANAADFAVVLRARVAVFAVRVGRAFRRSGLRILRSLLDINGNGDVGALSRRRIFRPRRAATTGNHDRDNGRDRTDVGRHHTVFHDSPVQKWALAARQKIQEPRSKCTERPPDSTVSYPCGHAPMM